MQLCLAIGSLPLRPAIEPAYPTSYYSPTEPYAAASIVRGAAVYAENCVLCHGAMGHGDGPAAEGLPIRPADLTEPLSLRTARAICSGGSATGGTTA